MYDIVLYIYRRNRNEHNSSDIKEEFPVRFVKCPKSWLIAINEWSDSEL